MKNVSNYDFDLRINSLIDKVEESDLSYLGKE